MRRRLVGGALTLAGVLAACGSGGPPDGAPGTTGEDPPITTTSEATPPSGSGATPPESTVAPATTDGSPPADTDAPRPASTVTTIAPTTTMPSTTTAPAATTTTPVDLRTCAAALPLRRRIALLVWPAVYDTDWPGAIATVADHQPGGVILMEPAIWGPGDVAAELARLDAAAARGLVVATDEEGGVVQRLALLGELPSQQEMSETLPPDDATRLIAVHGAVLADVGVDMALGPVVDVVPESGAVPLTRSRFFTGDPGTVSAFGRAYVEGWLSSGITPVLKHFPGHGAASGDTHDEPGITPSLAELEAADLVPFQELSDTGAAVMVGHLTVPDLTDGRPATQSARAVRYLRDDLGYGDALVMTDALGMEAVGLPEDEAAVLALVAGIDVVIFTATGRTGPVIDAIERAVGEGALTDDRITLSASRVLRHLDPERRGCG